MRDVSWIVISDRIDRTMISFYLSMISAKKLLALSRAKIGSRLIHITPCASPKRPAEYQVSCRKVVAASLRTGRF
jgi:hypothetical protein